MTKWNQLTGATKLGFDKFLVSRKVITKENLRDLF